MRDELLDGETFDSVTEARVVIGRYYGEYNHDRPHRGLKMATPLAFDRAERRRLRDSEEGADESHRHHCAWTKITSHAAATRPARLSQLLDQTQGAGQAELRRGDLDLARGVIRIRRGVTRAGSQIVVGTPKSASGVRDVAIRPHLLPMLKEHLNAHTGAAVDALPFPPQMAVR